MRNNPILTYDELGLWALSLGLSFDLSLLGGGSFSFGFVISYDDKEGFRGASYLTTEIRAGYGLLQLRYKYNFLRRQQVLMPWEVRPVSQAEV